MRIIVDQDISTIKDCLAPVIENRSLLRSEIVLKGKDKTTIEISSDDRRSLEKTKASIRRYLDILERLKK